MRKLKQMALGVAVMVFCAGMAGIGIAGAGEIMVSAAASLNNAFTEMAVAFEKTTQNTQVYTNFAASNPLLRQIQQGAPVNLFAAADQRTMDEATDFVVPGSRVDFAANSLVLIVPVQGSAVSGRADLPKAARLAVGNPDSVPAGRYAREALRKDWDSLRAKMIFGNNVRQVLDYVSRGEVDAGIVYRSDTLAVPGKVRIVEELSGHTPVVYPMALIKPDNTEARTFAAFVRSDAGKKILQKHGFTPLP